MYFGLSEEQEFFHDNVKKFFETFFNDPDFSLLH